MKMNRCLKWIAIVMLTAQLSGCDRHNQEVARALTGGDPGKGRVSIGYYGCASCHTIPGIPGADGLVGPPLSQIASRAYLGGVLKNTPQNMITWIRNPPAIDDKTAMPDLHLSEGDARDIASYLYTLR
jgi:cytochrome c